MENVTEYKAAEGEYVTYLARAALKKGYMFADGDEAFYHFVGKNSCYSMPELLHPDDVEDFVATVDALGDEKQRIIVRMRGEENKYRLFYVEMWHDGTVYDGFPSVSLSFCNFMELREKYIQYTGNVRKYREFMGLSQNMFFEYTFATGELNIYRYVNEKAQPVLRRSLEEIHDEIAASDQYSGKSKGEFEVLYEFLKKGVDRFSASFDAAMLLAETEGRLAFKGSMMYDNGMKAMTVGVIDLTDSKEAPKSYYMTDNAFDPGTGLWNKRAIHEYAVEKTLDGREMYLAIMDVDDFKKVNDTFGHMFGDEVLSKVAEILRSVLDCRGMVGRFGGDEFMLVFDSVTREEELRRILKTFSKNMQWAFRDIRESMIITTSCGVAKFPVDGSNFEELFQKADKALYIAKAKGKNRFIIYDEAKHGSVVAEGENDRNVGIKAIVSDSKKAFVMSEVVLALHTRGTDALAEAMEKMRSYFDIDGITVYCGEDLHRALTAGRYINPIGRLDFMENPSYRKLFDARGVYEESNLRRISNTQPEAYKCFELQETKEFVQFAAYREKKPKAVVAFDYFNRTPKIGASDMGLMTIVGRLMAEVSCALAQD